MLDQAAKVLRFFVRRRRPPPPGHNKDVFRRVWQAAFSTSAQTAPEEIAAALGLPWTVREAAEWKRHCKRCVSCGGWMYDPLTEHCYQCWDW